MRYEIGRRVDAALALAVVRERRSWSHLGAALVPLLDRVWGAIRGGRVPGKDGGRSVFVYRDGGKDGVTVEIGAEVGGGFTVTEDGVTPAETPGGDVVATVHVGPYRRLGDAHDAIVLWARREGVVLADVCWEVYGDHDEDESRLVTEVVYAVAAP